MKKVLLLTVAMAFGFSVFAQMKPAHIPDNYKNFKATKVAATHETMNFSTEINPYVAPQQSKSIDEVVIAVTRYDLQSNQSIQNRIYLFPDNTIGATCTWGMTETSFPDRGTGYNYNNGTAWGANPTGPVESSRCGWPSYCPIGTDGELVVTHNGSTGLNITKRTPKGTGAWTNSVLVGPTTTGGTTALLWPRTIVTNGDDIHIIACTDQAASGTYYYQGLALALVYYRSTDGGTTWDAVRILPGMDSASIVTTVNNGFSGDSYAWAGPKGDTIAFIVGDSWMDCFVMKSFDNGTTWTKVPVYDFPTLTVAPTPIIPSTDGYYALGIDNSGKAHVVLGKTRVSRDSLNSTQSSYYPYTDALVYWNEDMPVIDSTLLSNEQQMFTDGNLIATMIDYTGNDTIDFPVVPSGEWPFGTYYNSLSSFPYMYMEGNDIYISYSSCNETRIDAAGTKLYRDLYTMKRIGTTWSDPTLMTYSIIHEYDECVFGSISHRNDNYLHIVYQADDQPGLAVRGDEHPYGDNNIYYIKILKTDVGQPIGISETNRKINGVEIYPNPSSDYSYISLDLAIASKVKINVSNMVGQQVMSKDFGQLVSGTHTLVMNVNNLQAGIYFFTVNAGNDIITKKILVQ